MKTPNVLCDSAANKPMPKWMSTMAIGLAVLFLLTAYREYSEGGQTGKLVFNLFIGFVCVLGAGISRRIYLSDEGVVREMRSWGRVSRRILPWEDVRFVTLAFRGDRMMVFFEVDTTGWKVLFSREQENCVRDILDEKIPDVEVNVLKQ